MQADRAAGLLVSVSAAHTCCWQPAPARLRAAPAAADDDHRCWLLDQTHLLSSGLTLHKQVGGWLQLCLV